MAAPKGNKFAQGLTNSGRPPIYKKPQELYDRILEYFDYIEQEHEYLTITGLSLFLGFCSKGTLYEYAKKEEFSDYIKRALSIVEQHYEKKLNDSGAAGAIFALKNMGWEDKQKQEIAQNVVNTNTHKIVFERYKPENKK